MRHLPFLSMIRVIYIHRTKYNERHWLVGTFARNLLDSLHFTCQRSRLSLHLHFIYTRKLVEPPTEILMDLGLNVALITLCN